MLRAEVDPACRTWTSQRMRLERLGSQGPRIKDLRDLFVTQFRTPVETANKSVRSRFAS